MIVCLNFPETTEGNPCECCTKVCSSCIPGWLNRECHPIFGKLSVLGEDPHAKFKPYSINIEAFPPRQINILSKLQLATIKTCYLLSITSILSLVEMNLTNVILRLSYQSTVCKKYLKNLVYHFFLQPWLVLGVKLMEINSNWFSRYLFVFRKTSPNL